MTYAVRLSRRAELDLDRLEEFLIDRSPTAAVRAVEAITTGVLSLADHPHRGHLGPRPNLRQILVPFGDAGYVVQYRIDRDAIIVVRIKHARERS